MAQLVFDTASAFFLIFIQLKAHCRAILATTPACLPIGVSSMSDIPHESGRQFYVDYCDTQQYIALTTNPICSDSLTDVSLENALR